MASSSNENQHLWFSVTEETLFLHDGLLRVTDLVELPTNVNASPDGDADILSCGFDTTDTHDVPEKLLTVCGTQNSAYKRLIEYRLNSLRGYWAAYKELTQDATPSRELSQLSLQEETLNLFKKEAEQASFSTRIGLLLLLPLLQSQSRIDPKLCGVTAELLLNCLRECKPCSLSKEPGDCLKGLESLLCDWLGEDSKDKQIKVDDKCQREKAASALVALACARGHVDTFIHAADLLQQLPDLQTLPVADILSGLLDTRGGIGQPSTLLGNKHAVSWGFEDMLNVISEKPPDQDDKDKEKVESEIGRSIATDGKYLYTSNTIGKGLAKIGTGLHGTLRGYVYSRNLRIGPGRIAYGDNKLLYRPVTFDQDEHSNNLALLMDTNTLEMIKPVLKPDKCSVGKPCVTVGFVSDGMYFYLIWCQVNMADKSAKGINVYVETYSIEDNSLSVNIIKPSVILQKKDDNNPKTLTEAIFTRPRPFRTSNSTATLVALTGGEMLATRKEDVSTSTVLSTSCGIQLKTLIKTPVFCDGNNIVFLTSLHVQVLACNLCFNITDGQFNTRVDLMDAPSCSLARGTAVNSLGTCFDVSNNSIWVCSSDYIDQFYNPSNQAPHHINKRLCIPIKPKPTTTTGEIISVKSVVETLLQHAGGMCVHKLNSDPYSNYLLPPTPVDLPQLHRITDILTRAMEDGQMSIIISALVVLQLIFKTSVFVLEREGEAILMNKTRSLLWKLVIAKSSESSNIAIQREACKAISVGLMALYSNNNERHKLLYQLMTEGGESSGLVVLRDLILTDFAAQLKTKSLKSVETDHLRLEDELVHYILKRAVKGSLDILKRPLKTSRPFEETVTDVPVASPCVMYIMALQSYLLRETVFYVKDTDKDKENKTDNKSQLSSQDLITGVINLATKIFVGLCEVFETFIEVCNSVIDTSPIEEIDSKLQTMERLAKGTILGHLLPVLLTTLTHSSLQELSLANALMPHLTRLVLLSTQAAMLMRSPKKCSLPEDDGADPDRDMLNLIGQSIQTKQKDNETEDDGECYLASLKIPAPWASGKSIETIHPVRDNYKMKETIHIPGARCLYIRFDPKCSSQYDYDKLILYAGPNTNSKKIAEYGGNTFGFGSRSVLGSGWPKDLVKVDGDTVTFSFEMRSGREHNTPDKAMWGFLATVHAQESVEEVGGGLPFLADLALGLSVLSCMMLQIMFDGPEKTEVEITCQHLFKSKILQRCVWQSEPEITKSTEKSKKKAGSKAAFSPVLARIKLPTDLMDGLRKLSKRQTPRVRPSIKEVIQPLILEEMIMSAVVKHLSLVEALRSLPDIQKHETDEFWLLSSVVDEVFRRFDALIRQLQTLADLEQRWFNEVEEHRQEKNPSFTPYFTDYHLHELKHKELTMLCFLKEVALDTEDTERAVKTLREKFNSDVENSDKESIKSMYKTKQIVEGILSRLDLLLHVNISFVTSATTMTRTASNYANNTREGIMARSDTDMLRPGSVLGRSMSAPSGVEDDTFLEVMRLQRRRQLCKRDVGSILQDLVDEDGRDMPPHVALVDQLFSFIGSAPETSVSCEHFLKAAKVRWKRGNSRKNALISMKELLTSASRVPGSSYLLSSITSVLKHGPKVEELTCGGLVNVIQDAYAETVTSVVQLASKHPIAGCNSVVLLCTVPYTRAEEKCLVRSGLVHLLDQLCGLANRSTDLQSPDTQTIHQKVSLLAWAGFRVLASRCVTWETEEGVLEDDLDHSGLACQVSILLTHYLTRVTENTGNEAAGTEALQEVLALLNSLSRSRMGKAILSQPACVSKLLSLLLDQRPSPKLVLIILQLCGVALPLMSPTDCANVELPAWGQHLTSGHWSNAQPVDDPPAKIVSLLLAKLGDFLVPGDQVLLSSRSPSQEVTSGGHSSSSNKCDQSEDSDVQGGRISVYLHKKDDQTAHDVIQPLLSVDGRAFRGGLGASMERVSRMDRELTKSGKTEVVTEEAMTALRKAYKWAQLGLVLSTGPPTDTTQTDTVSDGKKKTATDVVCKEKNLELAKTDPVRAFISGHVANSMAAEVISLLHSLLAAPLTSSAQTWSEAVQRVLMNSVSCLPLLMTSLEGLGSPRCHTRQLMTMAKLANAALCALGGFGELVKPGCQIEIIGNDIHESTGNVITLSEQTDIAIVLLDGDKTDSSTPRYSDLIEIPVSRLRPVRNKTFLKHQQEMSDTVFTAVQALLDPQGTDQSYLQQSLPLIGDGNSLGNQTCRVVAEIKTRACMVLAQYLQNLEFAKVFSQRCGSSINIMKSLAKECNKGSRKPVIEAHVERLRMLYRDCAKPPPPPCKNNTKAGKEMVWNAGCNFPPARACLFSHGLTSVTFLGDPSASSGLPRGCMIYANQPIPTQAPSFYWEIKICSLGDSQDDSGVMVSFGFAPAAEKKDGAWTNPIGTCLLLNNGKAVHYNGASLLQWRSVRMDITLGKGDIAGIGWERTGSNIDNPKGRVYFTHQGQKLPNTIDDVSGGMFPVVHIQKKNCRVQANFGAHPFAFAEGQEHRDAAEAASDLTREIRESFGHLPFHPNSDTEEEGLTNTSSGVSLDTEEITSQDGILLKTANTPSPLNDYSTDTCLQYKVLDSYSNMIQMGPNITGQVVQDDQSDEEPMEDDMPVEDHYALLVKAWEQKVFPIIRRRFRNEAERKDGLEQIRGALQLGMTDIARQTVEFLYEENGGIPRDLHLPTIDDIKEDLAKFTIERVKKGTTVIIRLHHSSSTVLPKFAVRSMFKTFGATGTVLEIDSPNELVQVETYLRSEGVLVRFWYPIQSLEKPPQGLRKASISGGQTLDTSNIHIHGELISRENYLMKHFLRTAFLYLIEHCNSPGMEVTNDCSPQESCAATLQQLDLENIQLLAGELLAPPTSAGIIQTSLIGTTCEPNKTLNTMACSLSSIMFSDAKRLQRELAIAISRAANQGEDYLLELTNQICSCLPNAPEMFACMEFPVSNLKTIQDVEFPGAACLVVSCKTDPKGAKKESSPYKSPWARISTHTGRRVKKSGEPVRQLVVSYPNDVTSSSNMNEQYCPAIIPGDRVNVRVGVAPPPGIILTIHALPLQFLTAITYLETLLTEKFGCGMKGCELHRGEFPHQKSFPTLEQQPSLWSLDNITITPSVFGYVIEQLCSYIWRTDIPALIKEFVFHILAQAFRILDFSAGGHGNGLTHVNKRFSPLQGLLNNLPVELKKLYEDQIKDWQSASGIGASDSGRFSTYFHALMEVNLAISEVNDGCSEKSEGATAPEVTATSPGSGAVVKKKKLKSKKERERSTSGRKTSASPRVSESDSSTATESLAASSSSSLSVASTSTDTTNLSTSPSSKQSSSTSLKTDEQSWFKRVVSVNTLIRSLAFSEESNEKVLSEAVTEAYKELTIPSAHSRLLILTGIPEHVPVDKIKQAVNKVCSVHGGLDKDGLYVPNYEIKLPEKPGEAAEKTTPPCSNRFAVIALPAGAKLEAVKKSLYKCKPIVIGLNSDEEGLIDIPDEVLSISTVNSSLLTEVQSSNMALENFLSYKLYCGGQMQLQEGAVRSFTDIFHSCYFVAQQTGIVDLRSGFITLEKEHILKNSQDNMLYLFLNNMRPPKKPLADLVTHILLQYGTVRTPDKEAQPPSDKNGKGKPAKKSPRSTKEKVVFGTLEKNPIKDRKVKGKDIPEKTSKDLPASFKELKIGSKGEGKSLTLDGFLQYIIDTGHQDIRSIWRALLATGFDFHYNRCSCTDINQAQQLTKQWTREMDSALVVYINQLTRQLAVGSARLHPHEIILSESDLASDKYVKLQGVPLESIRLRFALLQKINVHLESFFLPLVDLRPYSTFSRSTAHVISKIRNIIFYDLKNNLVNRILNATALRKPDQAAPEITLDPLETIGGEKKYSFSTVYCQAYRQLSNIPSSRLCVRLASGGDPTYSFNVRLTGEEVHGNSGSFRHFLGQIAKELQSSAISFLVPCPSSSTGINRGKCFLKPGKMTYPEEKLLQFLGQLLGVTMRADIPLELDIVSSFWKCLTSKTIDPITDIHEADILTYNYIKKIEMIETEGELQALCSDVYPRFVYSSLMGDDTELIPGGHNIPVSWNNRHKYVEAIRNLRLKELLNVGRMECLKTGLASIIPIQLLNLYTPTDLEIRTCGLPIVNLQFLKMHTMYQIGLTDTDPHIEYFWETLESFTPEELAKFIKFACNQERIPQRCPCQDGGLESAHVPPYPMKIAPPDGTGPADKRYIRVETCLFMIKLPQYSSQEVMSDRLRYAINCREDPLSG
ncbi:probable E3 ubiquitin-protein ligase HECTD4 [Patella vulgata]|uniref:probable E3 ubiquitin-protein ligase HECTD4 n=1 Tax=Patella vulgata TaxID=6465 RepID=UPI0024A890BD|nr:probable E3 ubiquitin-protein ligase HECTD4 [Patella vulgata]